jgi:hypothetical protein
VNPFPGVESFLMGGVKFYTPSTQGVGKFVAPHY